MPERLIITNTDAAAGKLDQAGLADGVLAWLDPLCFGPVPPMPDLATLTRLRAAYIASEPWGFSRLSEETLLARDAVLIGHGAYEDVTLWFEHDLLDQLQLVQILDWFHTHRRKPGTLRYVPANDYIEFLDIEDVHEFAEKAIVIDETHTALAARVWSAFRDSTPEAFANLLKYDLRALPFLRSAIIRLLEELPAPATGLARSERQILDLLKHGIRQARPMYMGHLPV
ncbi:MAG: hypothetical protein R3D33_06635 [Hyphomicrobiaceae bacterium]